MVRAKPCWSRSRPRWTSNPTFFRSPPRRWRRYRDCAALQRACRPNCRSPTPRGAPLGPKPRSREPRNDASQNGQPFQHRSPPPPCVPVGGSGPRKHQPPDEHLILGRRRGQVRSVPTMRPQITSLLKHAVPTCDDEGHTLRHHSGDENNVARKPVQLRDQDAAFHGLGGGEGGSANRQSRPARDRWAVETVAREAITGSIAERPWSRWLRRQSLRVEPPCSTSRLRHGTVLVLPATP